MLDRILLRARLSAPFMRQRIARGEQAFIDAWNASGGQARLDARAVWLEQKYDALLAALNGWTAESIAGGVFVVVLLR